jgi:UDP-glucose 4-epimerase
MKVLVTGGAGYIGSHTIKELLAKNYEVLTYDNLSNGHKAAILDGEFVLGDLSDVKKLDKTFKNFKPDTVIHFAASIEAGESVIKPDLFFKNNVVYGLNLLNVMIKNKTKYLIFSSSAAVYGEPKKIPIHENDPTLPKNPYGLTKLHFEQILKTYKEAYGLNSISLRYFNAAGADPEGQLGSDHKSKTLLIVRAMLAALGKIPYLEIFGTDYNTPDGTGIRDYIHVTDLALAHILALEKLDKDNQNNVYNLGDEKGVSVREVINMTKKVTGVDFKIKESPRRPGDPAKLVASSEKAKKELGFKPKYSDLETIIKTAWNWHRNHPDGYKN